MEYLFPVPELSPRGFEAVVINLPTWAVLVIEREAAETQKTRDEFLYDLIIKGIPEE